MTTDSEAWVRFAAAVLASGEDPRPAHAASVADNMMTLYRERQRRGDFGARVYENGEPGSKSSYDSMEERIRALGDALTAAAKALQAIAEGGCGYGVDVATMGFAMDQARLARRALHPHKSWCRGDHSEGACVSESMEVDRGE